MSLRDSENLVLRFIKKVFRKGPPVLLKIVNTYTTARFPTSVQLWVYGRMGAWYYELPNVVGVARSSTRQTSRNRGNESESESERASEKVRLPIGNTKLNVVMPKKNGGFTPMILSRHCPPWWVGVTPTTLPPARGACARKHPTSLVAHSQTFP